MSCICDEKEYSPMCPVHCRLATSEINALRNIINAWEDLPEGNHSPQRIEDWITQELHPTIQQARKVLKASIRKANY